MRDTLKIICVSLVVLSTDLIRAADVEAPLPNDADVVVCVHFEQLLNSPLGRRYLRASLEEGFRANVQAQEFFKALEFDPFKDLSRLTLALSSTNTDKGYVIVTGKFNRDKIASLASRIAAENKDKFKIHQSNGVTVYEAVGDENNKTLFASFVGTNNLVLSTDKALLLSGGKTGKPKKELTDAIKKADGKHTAWLVALPAAANALPIEDQNQKNALQQVDSILGTVKVDTGARLEIHLQGKTPQTALAINKMIVDLVSWLKLNGPTAIKEKPELAPLFEVVNAIRTNVRMKTVIVSADLTAAQIEKLVKQAGK